MDIFKYLKPKSILQQKSNIFFAKQKIIVLVFVSLTILTSCSTKFAYNYLDWIIPWYIGDFVTLNDDQRFKLDSLVQTSLTWHRKTQLPDYVSTLENIQQDLNHPIARDALSSYYARYRQFASTLMHYIARPGSEMLLSLTPAQHKELFNNLEDQNLEYLQEFSDVNPAKRHKKRVSRMVDRFENWLDDLTKSQLHAIEQWSLALIPIVELWIKDRREWQSKLQTLINTNSEPESLENAIRRMITNHEQSWDLEYRSAIEQNTKLTLDLIHQILNEMNTTQKKYLKKQIGSMIRQFNDIHNQT